MSLAASGSGWERKAAEWATLMDGVRSLSLNDVLYGPAGFTLKKAADMLSTKPVLELLFVLYLVYLPICELCKALAPYPNFNPKKPQEATAGARFFNSLMDFVCTVWNGFLAVFSIAGAYHFLQYAYVGLVQQGCTLVQFFTESCPAPGGGMLDFRADATLSWFALLFVLSKVVEFGDTWLYCFQKGKDHLFLHWCVYFLPGLSRSFLSSG